MTPTPEQIRTTRRAACMSKAALARLLGVGWLTVHNWERGAHPMAPQRYEYLLFKLAQRAAAGRGPP